MAAYVTKFEMRGGQTVDPAASERAVILSQTELVRHFGEGAEADPKTPFHEASAHP